MNRTRMNRLHKKLIALSMGGAALSVGLPFGCDATRFANYRQLFGDAGAAAIGTVSNGVAANTGQDFDNIVLAPLTTFAQNVWRNWISDRIAVDPPNFALAEQ